MPRQDSSISTRSTLNLDPDKLEAAITHKTKAIVAVEAFGHPGGMGEVEQIARRHELVLIEDCCEGFGGRVGERCIGSFGRAGVFAFYPNKQITTGEGGMIVTDDERFAALCRSLRNQGRDGMNWLAHERLGYNYRLSEINAALGVAQCGRLEAILADRRRVAHEYITRLMTNRHLILPTLDDQTHMSWFVFVVRLNDLFEPDDRDDIIKQLRGEGIGCNNYFPPIHLQPYMRDMLRTKGGRFSGVRIRLGPNDRAAVFQQDDEPAGPARVRNAGADSRQDADLAQCEVLIAAPSPGTQRQRVDFLPMTRSRIATLLCLLIFVGGCAGKKSPARESKRPLDKAQRQANVESFDRVWTAIRDEHWDPKLGGLDWNAVRDELRPKVEQAKTMAEAREVMEDMIGRLKQSHFAIIPREVYHDLTPSQAGEEKPASGERGALGLDVRILDGQAVVWRSLARHAGGAQRRETGLDRPAHRQARCRDNHRKGLHGVRGFEPARRVRPRSGHASARRR